MSIENIKENSAINKMTRDEAIEKFRNIKDLVNVALTNESFNVLTKLGFNVEDIKEITNQVFFTRPCLPNDEQINSPKHIELPGDGIIASAFTSTKKKLETSIEVINKLIARNNYKEIGFFGITDGADSENISMSLHLAILNSVRDTNPEVKFYVMDNMVGKNSVGGTSDKYRTPEEAFENRYNFDLVIVGANHLIECQGKMEYLLDNALRNNYNVYDINTSLLYKSEAVTQTETLGFNTKEA